MRPNWWLSLLFILLALARPAGAQPLARAALQATPPVVTLSAPLPGQVLQGKVPITGNTAIEGFQSIELTFAYANNPTGTWFLILYSSLPVADGLLAQWDTTTITDGDYTLRLVVRLADGSQQTLTLPGLRVRNYTPIETDTPPPPVPSATPAPGQAPIQPPTATLPATATALPPTPTALPTNPAEVSTLALARTLGIGALAGWASWPPWASISPSAGSLKTALERQAARLPRPPAMNQLFSSIRELQSKLHDSQAAPAGEPFLIVGLGNPGRRYEHNRHNVGFMLLNHLAARLGETFSRLESRALLLKVNYQGCRLVLAKPQTYMNGSGAAVGSLLRFYKIPLTHLMVAYDDVDLPLGALRLRPGGGSAGQKGMQSIIERLGSEEFARLRIGIDRPPGRMEAADYVLQDFSKSQMEILTPTLEKATDAVLTFVTAGLNKAMNLYNTTGNSEQ
jgi:PTH1 family peptidyl-tRNA hydrolase